MCHIACRNRNANYSLEWFEVYPKPSLPLSLAPEFHSQPARVFHTRRSPLSPAFPLCRAAPPPAPAPRPAHPRAAAPRPPDPRGSASTMRERGASRAASAALGLGRLQSRGRGGSAGTPGRGAPPALPMLERSKTKHTHTRAHTHRALSKRGGRKRVL